MDFIVGPDTLSSFASVRFPPVLGSVVLSQLADEHCFATAALLRRLAVCSVRSLRIEQCALGCTFVSFLVSQLRTVRSLTISRTRLHAPFPRAAVGSSGKELRSLVVEDCPFDFTAAFLPGGDQLPSLRELTFHLSDGYKASVRPLLRRALGLEYLKLVGDVSPKVFRNVRSSLSLRSLQVVFGCCRAAPFRIDLRRLLSLESVTLRGVDLRYLRLPRTALQYDFCGSGPLPVHVVPFLRSGPVGKGSWVYGRM